MRVHILTPGCTTPNGAAFLFPILHYRRALAARGIDIRLVGEAARARDCDVTIVDSKFHRARWERETTAVVSEFEGLKRRASRLLYFDTTDSTAGVQVEILPVVDAYFKNQLLCDRGLYLKPIYGARIYADYYHRTLGINDSAPEYSSPVPDPTLLSKLYVSWNSGLADYSLLGPARMAIYRRMPLPALLRFPVAVARTSRPRPNPVSCRFGVAYSRQSVAWQRLAIRQKLGGRVATDKLSRLTYFRELAASKLVVSPFGFGEITLKDFEVFLTGGLLLKPDMTHLETWPDFFRAGETMIAHRWDLSDLEERIDEALADEPRCHAIAGEGQSRYLNELGTPDAEARFADRFAALISRQAAPQQSRAAS